MAVTNKKILIFDDDEDILSICTYVLEEAGWQVFTSQNCNAVVEKVLEIDPILIIMDNWLPDTGGIVATQMLKSSPAVKHIPVLYFSANSKVSELAAEAGADAYLAKPFDLTALEKMVSDHAKTNAGNLL